MGFQQQREKIKEICKGLLDENKVELVLGFTSGELPDSTVPFFITKTGQLEELKWDLTCTPNLAGYLKDMKQRAAIIAKPCDARAIAVYLSERQIKREEIYIIGVECAGMTGRDGSADPACTRCSARMPTVYDTLVEYGECGMEESKAAVKIDNAGPDTNETAAGTFEENLNKFKNELKKCILCYSCRQACYGCYCQTCFMERGAPDWLPADPDLGAKITFHLGRAMHMAGRCIGCGACERACPSGVKINYLVRELNRFIKEMYNYEPGMDPGETGAMLSFADDDREIGFLKT